jgi:putative oxidoreductase
MFKEIGFTDIVLFAASVAGLYRIRRALPGSGLRAWHDRHASSRTRTRWHLVLALEATELVLAGIFLLVGGAKLIGRPEMVALFRDIGFGQWFRYVTGTVEVAGAALLVIPMLSGASSLLLGGVMIAATLIELFVLHRPPVAALACLSGHTYVAWARMSHRHRSWLHGHASPRATVAHRMQTTKARWNFGQINAGRRQVRRQMIRLGE